MGKTMMAMQSLLLLGLGVQAQNAVGSPYFSLNHHPNCTCAVPTPPAGAPMALPYGTGPSCKGMKLRGGANETRVYGADDCPPASCTCPPKYFKYTCGKGQLNAPLDSVAQTDCQGTPFTCYFCMRCENLLNEIKSQIRPIAAPMVTAQATPLIIAGLTAAMQLAPPAGAGMTAAAATAYVASTAGQAMVAAQVASSITGAAADMAAGFALLPTCSAPATPECVGPACGKKMCGIVAGDFPTEEKLPSKELDSVIPLGGLLLSATWMQPTGLEEKNVDKCKADCTCPCPDAREHSVEGEEAPRPTAGCTCPDGFEYMTLQPEGKKGARKCGDYHCSYCVKAGPSAVGIIIGVVLVLSIFGGIYYCFFAGGKEPIPMDGGVEGGEGGNTATGGDL